MTSKQFCARTILASGVLAALGALVNWRANLYGLYGNVRGEKRVVASNERWSKYLYAYNQIPSNFDGLMVGSSISANLDLSRVHSARVYNLSMTGANITEENRILSVALSRARFKLVVYCLTPYLLKDHGLKAGGMEPRDYWAGLGSLPLIEDYVATVAIRTGAVRGRFDGSGLQNLELAGTLARDPDQAVADELRRSSRDAVVKLDPEAERELAASLAATRAAGAQIIAFFPPVYAPRYRAFKVEFQGFADHIRALLDSRDGILDYNDGRLEEFSTDSRNYLDGVHYTSRGAVRLSEALGRAIDAWVFFRGPGGDLPRSGQQQIGEVGQSGRHGSSEDSATRQDQVRPAQ